MAANPKSIRNLVQRTARDAPLAAPAAPPDAPRTRTDGKLSKRLQVARGAAKAADPEQPLYAVWASMVDLVVAPDAVGEGGNSC